VDFSNTAMAFTDKESIIKKYNIIIKKLLIFRLLCLTNSILTLFITDYFTTCILIGPYTKVIFFFITKLSPATLIILGIP
jgi:hypothetical protein